MDINITKFFNNELPQFYSASVAEMGNNAGKITFDNAMYYSEDNPLLDQSQLGEFLEFFDGFGAWEEEECSKWSLQECNALLVQFISGDIREFCGDEWDWLEYEQGCIVGLYSGRLFKGVDNEIYYCISE
tara:strand:+ start:672 stop:1061 length:390 start_codon:yes stop_codon:yes gene_type:complete